MTFFRTRLGQPRATAIALVACAIGAGYLVAHDAAAVRIAHAQCAARGPLPDPSCTPGASDPRVTQADIAQTICVRGYTRLVRPSRTFTDRLKRQQMADYRYYAGRSPRRYEEDHLVPLELGGAPRDPRNLWPEARAGALGSSAKDALENALHADVCASRVTLAGARHEIATDWVSAYRRLALGR